MSSSAQTRQRKKTNLLGRLQCRNQAGRIVLNPASVLEFPHHGPRADWKGFLRLHGKLATTGRMRRDISRTGRAVHTLLKLSARKVDRTTGSVVTFGDGAGKRLVARKLRTYQTSLGFFDLAIAAPSMKAALEAWGADSNLFHQGAAKESDDADLIAATMAKPGVVLRRPVGSDGSFAEHAELPTNLGGGERPTNAASKSKGPKAKKPASRPIDKVAERKAALA